MIHILISLYRRVGNSGTYQIPDDLKVSCRILRSVFLASLCVSPWSTALGEIYVMPREFVQYAATHGCIQIDEFFDKSGAINPPYLYGYLQGDREDSGVLWCKKKVADDKPYLLLIFLRESSGLSLTCPKQIEWWNPPGGLSLHKERVLTLNSFKKISDMHHSGPKNQRLEHNVIVSSYDGVSVVFYCHKGDWYYRMSH